MCNHIQRSFTFAVCSGTHAVFFSVESLFKYYNFLCCSASFLSHKINEIVKKNLNQKDDESNVLIPFI